MRINVEPAFVAIYRRHRNDVYRFAYAMAKSASVAQDVTQEVFLNVLENAAYFDAAKGSARAWLLGCARHLILDRLRLERRWAGADALPEETVPCASEDSVLAEQRLDKLHAAIAALPVEYREVLVLCELEELTYAECAAVLECPIGTVRSRLHRGRGLLAAMLTATEPAALGAPPAPAAVRAWCLYDWANSSFATTITAAVLPPYFAAVAARSMPAHLATAWWGYASAAAMLAAAIVAPVLGATADRLGRRKRILFGCVLVGSIARLATKLSSPSLCGKRGSGRKTGPALGSWKVSINAASLRRRKRAWLHRSSMSPAGGDG